MLVQIILPIKLFIAIIISVSYADIWCSLKSAFKPAKITSSLGMQEKNNLQIACKISLQFLNVYLKYIFNYRN